MNRLRKALTLAALTLVAAASLLTFKPVRVWASQEGSYIYHQFFLQGPAVFYGASTQFTGSDGTARLGVTITTGTPTAMTGVTSVRWLGAVASAPTSHNVGDMAYDISKSSLIISTSAATNSTTGWVRGTTTTDASVAAWTAY